MYTRIQSLSKAQIKKTFLWPWKPKATGLSRGTSKKYEKAFGDNAHQMRENLLYAKVSPHPKKIHHSSLHRNGTYDRIVKHLEREMELNGLEADEFSVKTQITVTKKNKVLKN